MKRPSMEEELHRLERIKTLVVIAIFSDDALMERLVLKGGNALDIVHEISARASLDVDFSMSGDFAGADEKIEMLKRIESALVRTFHEEGYQVFDVRTEERPEGLTPDLASFWGGYGVEFKLIELEKHGQFANDLEQLRRNALQFNPGASSKFTIDISKFEFTEDKQPQDLRNYRIFVYSPEMIVGEKLRAICQQMPEYGSVVKRNRAGAPRARDFVDIFTIVDARGIDMCSVENRLLLEKIFEAKRVPLELLDVIEKYRQFHAQDFPAVQAAAKLGVNLKAFDFYFDFVVDLARKMRSEQNQSKVPCP